MAMSPKHRRKMIVAYWFAWFMGMKPDVDFFTLWSNARDEARDE